MKLFVINLESSVERRQKICEQLNQQNISYEIFKAVDGRQEFHPLFKKYNDNRRKRYKHFRLSSSQLGCYASHYLLWEKCVELREPIIIMEDDIDIGSNFIEAVNLSEKVIDFYFYIRLAGTSHNKPFVNVAQYNQFKIIRFIKGPSGAQCYALHPKAAMAFIKYSLEWFVPVDDFMDKFWLHKVNCWAIAPFPVSGNSPNRTILVDKIFHDSIFDLPARRINRYIDRIKRYCYNLTFTFSNFLRKRKFNPFKL